MTKQYQELLALVARNAAIAGEVAADVAKKDETVTKEAITDTLDMTQRYRNLEDKINAGQPLEMFDYGLLYIGAQVSRNTIAKNVNSWTAVLNEYDNNLIPSLEAIAMEKDDEARMKKAKEIFGE